MLKVIKIHRKAEKKMVVSVIENKGKARGPGRGQRVAHGHQRSGGDGDPR